MVNVKSVETGLNNLLACWKWHKEKCHWEKYFYVVTGMYKLTISASFSNYIIINTPTFNISAGPYSNLCHGQFVSYMWKIVVQGREIFQMTITSHVQSSNSFLVGFFETINIFFPKTRISEPLNMHLSIYRQSPIFIIIN